VKGIPEPTTCAISTYHHYSCEFESHSWQGVFDKTLKPFCGGHKHQELAIH
jgi:hypothetical protein